MNRRILASSITAAVVIAAAGTAVAASGSSSGTASDYTPLASAVRLADTRPATHVGTQPAGAIGPGGLLTVTLGTNVPAGATAVTVNLTAAGATTGGVATAYADGTARPGVSSINFGKGETIANEITVPVTDGKIDVWNGFGATQFIVDLEGYYTPAAAAYVPPQTVTQTLAGVASVNTGGSFNARATEVGTVDLAAGSYLVTLSAKATPIVQGNTSVQVFPSVHLYSQPKNAAFTGDVLDAGGTALESGTITNADLYSSNSGVVTLTQDTTMYVYATGYDSDSGEGTYQLDGVTVTATPVNVASN